MVNGGTAVNIVPNFTGFDFDIRYLPSQDPYDLLAEISSFMERSALPELRRISDKTEAKVIVHPGGAIALDTDENDPVIRWPRH